jgi:hypothetical protein
MSRRKKSKCNVLVIGANGTAHTTRRGARRLVEQGLARTDDRVDMHSPEWHGPIYMVESHPSFQCESKTPHSPQLAIVPFHCSVAAADPDGFLRYPMRSQVSGGLEAQYPALARAGAGLKQAAA